MLQACGSKVGLHAWSVPSCALICTAPYRSTRERKTDLLNTVDNLRKLFIGGYDVFSLESAAHAPELESYVLQLGLELKARKREF